MSAVLDLELTTPPTGDVLTLAQAKRHLAVVDADEDADIQDAIDAAVDYLDGYSGVLGRCLLSQQWSLHFDYAFTSWRIELPLSPLITVDAITYVDSQGVTQTVAPGDYQVITGTAAAVQPAFGKAWPAPRSQARAVTVKFTAGYANADDIPAAIRTVVRMLVGHFYANREATVGIDQRGTPMELPLGVTWLLARLGARTVR